MDLYLSNSSFTKDRVIDDYETCIWKDRYVGIGDFELRVPYREWLASNLKTYKYLRMSESESIMMIETAEFERPEDDDTENLIRVTGRSLEAFLENRSAASSTTDGRKPLDIEGSRSFIANKLVTDYTFGNANAVNHIPGLSVGDVIPGDPSVKLSLARGPLDEMLDNILRPANLGWRIGPVYPSGLSQEQLPGQIRFHVYTGVDRTIDAPGVEYLEFSENNENLIDISTLESIAVYKNHARMVGAKTGTNVYLPDTPSTVSGFERRTVVVDATDIGADSTTTVAEDQVALTQRGLEILNAPENKYLQLIDGQAAPDLRTFNAIGLGDIVWVRGPNRVKVKNRVTEKVWTSDATGDKRLPTFEAL